MKIIAFVFLIFISSSILADTQDNSNILFNWAETQYPELFSPAGQNSHTFNEWYYRYYPSTKNYVGVNTDDDVYILGASWEGQGEIKVNTLQTLLHEASLSEIIVPGECVVSQGLMWELKSEDGGYRDSRNFYTWYKPEPPVNIDGYSVEGTSNPYTDNCEYGNIQCTTYHYVEEVNKQQLCGYNDWRPPTKEELLNRHLPVSLALEYTNNLSNTNADVFIWTSTLYFFPEQEKTYITMPYLPAFIEVAHWGAYSYIVRDEAAENYSFWPYKHNFIQQEYNFDAKEFNINIGIFLVRDVLEK